MIQAMKRQNLLQKSGVIDSQTTKGKYKQGDYIKFETETIKSSLWGYSDAFILVTGNITVNHFLHAQQKLMMHLIEYSDNYSNTSGNLWQFKRDEVTDRNADLTIDNSQSFKYKAVLVGKAAKCC